MRERSGLSHLRAGRRAGFAARMLARGGDGGDIRSVTTPTPTSPTTGALDAILKPRTIAVVGASRAPNTIGHQIVANLVERGFTGAVYPVNPKAHAVCA